MVLKPLLIPDWESYTTANKEGILPSQRIQELIDGNEIVSRWPISPDQVQPASMDLRIGPVAYRIRASFLSNKESTVTDKLRDFTLYEVDLTRPTVLERDCVYIAPLMEELRLPKTIWGRANPKSTTGRIDVFTRLITESGGEFESVSEGYHGKLYTEIVPRTFSITVHEGVRLNQLRLGQGNAENFSRKLKRETLVYTEDELPGKHQLSDEKLWLTVDLQGDPDSRIVGYRAKRNAPIIDLARVNYYDPEEFWEPVYRMKRANLILDPQDFYILASKQRVSIPPSWAAEMVPYDPSMGEFRIHYAGFFDPGFGYGAEDVPGTQAVLEVRSHEVPFLLEDGQTVGRLEFEPLLEVPKRIYGQGIGSSYQRQGLALSKHFRR